MNFKLKIWRQSERKIAGQTGRLRGARHFAGHFVSRNARHPERKLLGQGDEPIAFDSDCREGICGTCSLTINGEAHGPDHPGAVCELYMRKFRDGATITVEPFRVRSFPIIKDLVIDRSALDRIVQAGGFISARAGSAPEANSTPIPKHDADLAMEAAAASVVEHALRLVQIGPPCSSRRRKCHIYRCCRREIPSAQGAF